MNQSNNKTGLLLVFSLYFAAALICLQFSSVKNSISSSMGILYSALFAALLTILYVLFGSFDDICLYIFLGICLIAAIYCSFHFSVNLCPDEEGRILLSNWMYKYRTLPTGYEYELIDPDPLLDPYHDYSSPNWGYDYAFTPYLPSMLGTVMMHIISVFSDSRSALLTAARSVNIFAYAVSMIYSLKLSRELFKERGRLFVILTAGIPQVLFISGYLNNDLFSLMSSIMIVYYLIRCHRTCWSQKMCIMLGISISLSLLTYYFGYGLIFIAAVWAMGDCIICARMKFSDSGQRTRFVLKRALIVVFIVLILAGWYFIRNAVIYEGDVLGIKSQHHCAELYEAAGHDVYDPPTFSDRNATWKYWFDITLKSLVGIFGYMDILMEKWIYVLYDVLFFIGMFLYFIHLFRKEENRRKSLLMDLAAFASIVFPLIFSMYRSVTYDFEPQGRYIISALPALAYMITSGYAHFSSIIPKRLHFEKTIIHAENFICPLLVSLWFVALVRYILPLAVY